MLIIDDTTPSSIGTSETAEQQAGERNAASGGCKMRSVHRKGDEFRGLGEQTEPTNETLGF